MKATSSGSKKNSTEENQVFPPGVFPKSPLALHRRTTTAWPWKRDRRPADRARRIESTATAHPQGEVGRPHVATRVAASRRERESYIQRKDSRMVHLFQKKWPKLDLVLSTLAWALVVSHCLSSHPGLSKSRWSCIVRKESCSDAPCLVVSGCRLVNEGSPFVTKGPAKVDT